MPRLFAVRNSPLCGGAACLTAEPVTVTADAHGKAPGGIPVRIFVDAPPCGSVGATALRPVCATVCLSVRYSVALCAPYESVCFHQSKPKTNHYQVEVVLVFSFLISSFYFQALKNAVNYK